MNAHIPAEHDQVVAQPSDRVANPKAMGTLPLMIAASPKERGNAKEKLITLTHWLVNFIGIGWVLNAKVSVVAYEGLEHTYSKSFANAVAKFGEGLKALDKQKWFTGDPVKTAEFSRDFIAIALMGIGGFLVIPLQRLYEANKHRIERGIGRVYDTLRGQNNADDTKSAKPQEEVKESWSHWSMARVLAFSSGLLGYLTFKYGFPRAFNSFKVGTVSAVEKYVPQMLQPKKLKTAENYLAEQIATFSAVMTLWISKIGLDKLFPPKVLKKTAANEIPAATLDDMPQPPPVDNASPALLDQAAAAAFSHATKLSAPVESHVGMVTQSAPLAGVVR